MIILKRKYLRLAACGPLPLILGGISALPAVAGSMAEYAMIEQPPLSPPGWLFPAAWSVLYVLMGAASYIVLCSGAPLYERRSALKLYAVQLVVNVLWPPYFSGWGSIWRRWPGLHCSGRSYSSRRCASGGYRARRFA